MKIKESWNLGLLYKSPKDPLIEKDLAIIEQAYIFFEKKYRGKSFTNSPSILAKALKDFEKLTDKVRGMKPWWYFALRVSLDSQDEKAGALATKHSQRLTEASNRIRFFTLEIGKITKQNQKRFLNHKSLKTHSYFLKKIFDKSKYLLSEGEEQLASLLILPGYNMWIDAQEKILSDHSIKHKGKDWPIPKAANQLAELPKKERQEVQGKISDVYKTLAPVAEAEINAVYNFKKIMDHRRGFKNSYSATILGYENDEKNIESFIDLVTRYFKLSHRFYKLHAKLLKEKTLTYADRGVKMGEIKKKFDFSTSVSILHSLLMRVDREYGQIFEELVTNGQIDVHPKKGKQGGAYCWGMDKLPIFLLLNDVGELKSFETLAHEVGHAIHTVLSRKQPPLYRGYTTTTAEVASTFFEQLAMEEIEQYLSEKEKVVILHSRLMGDMASIFRQVACFNFEKELHDRIRKEGKVNKEDLAKLMQKHLKSYLGQAIKVTEDDGYGYVYWSHIRKFFYVYTYAYGQIISRSLYEHYKVNPAFGSKIKQFLSAGGSMSPEEIFKSIGIDTSSTAFFEAGLKSIEKDISRLEKLAR